MPEWGEGQASRMTVLKVADDKQPQLDALTRLLERPDIDDRTRKRVEDEIWSIRTGIQGERDAAYEIDFYYSNRDNHAVIHDLRIEFADRVAQIDHLLINRVLDVWVCETKAFSQGVKINDYGEWSRYGPKFAQGIPSPVEQNRHHLEVLRDVFAKGAVHLPRRLVTLKPRLYPVVLISNEARIDRPKSKAAAAKIDGLETVIKIEQFIGTIEKSYDERNPFPAMARLVGKETIQDLGRQLVGLHRPATFDFAAKFGLTAAPRTTPVQAAALEISAKSSAARVSCESCGKGVSDRTMEFLRENKDRYGERVLCFDCQRAFRRSQRSRES